MLLELWNFADLECPDSIFTFIVMITVHSRNHFIAGKNSLQFLKTYNLEFSIWKYVLNKIIRKPLVSFTSFKNFLSLSCIRLQYIINKISIFTYLIKIVDSDPFAKTSNNEVSGTHWIWIAITNCICVYCYLNRLSSLSLSW